MDKLANIRIRFQVWIQSIFLVGQTEFNDIIVRNKLVPICTVTDIGSSFIGGSIVKSLLTPGELRRDILRRSEKIPRSDSRI